MTIYNFSPQKHNVTSYVQNQYFDSRLMFSSTYNKLYYTLVQSEFEINHTQTSIVNDKYKVISSGIINGFENTVEGDGFDYKFDLKNYINFQTNNSLGVNTNFTPTNSINYSEYTKNIYLLTSQTNYPILVSPTYFVKNLDGYLFTTVVPTSIPTVDVKTFVFKNGDSNVNSWVLPSTIVKNTILPINFSKSTTAYKLKITKVCTSGDVVEYITNVSVNSNGVYFTFIPFDCESVRFTSVLIASPFTESLINEINTTVIGHQQTTNILTPCVKQVLFYDRNNLVQSIYTTANHFIEETTNKEYITIGNQKIVKDNTVQKIQHVHLGYGQSENDIYDLNNGTFFWTIDSNSNNVLTYLNRWINNNSSFASYVGLNLSEKNIELTGTSEKTYKRYNNQKINFFD